MKKMINKYFVYLENDNSDGKCLLELFRSLLRIFNYIEIEDGFIIEYEDYPELMLEESLKAYIYDVNTVFKCYISDLVSASDIKSDEEIMLKYLRKMKNNKLYHTHEVMLELIAFPYDDLKVKALREYLRDIETYTIITTFIENDLNVLTSSKKLYMHRNTLMNKLDKFYEKTGYDIRNFKDAYIIYSLIKDR